MPLILRPMNRHAEIMGDTPGWCSDDYVVLDQDRSGGRTHKELIQGDTKWRWAITTSPYPCVSTTQRHS